MDTKVAITSTPAQVPLKPSVGPSGGSTNTRGGISDRSACASHFQQARKKLTHILLVASLTDRLTLVKVFFTRYTTIYSLHVEMLEDLKDLWIQDGTNMTPNDVDDLLSLARYANLYIRACGNSVSELTWKEMNSDHVTT